MVSTEESELQGVLYERYLSNRCETDGVTPSRTRQSEYWMMGIRSNLRTGWCARACLGKENLRTARSPLGGFPSRTHGQPTISDWAQPSNSCSKPAPARSILFRGPQHICGRHSGTRPRRRAPSRSRSARRDPPACCRPSLVADAEIPDHRDRRCLARAGLDKTTARELPNGSVRSDRQGWTSVIAQRYSQGGSHASRQLNGPASSAEPCGFRPAPLRTPPRFSSRC